MAVRSRPNIAMMMDREDVSDGRERASAGWGRARKARAAL